MIFLRPSYYTSTSRPTPEISVEFGGDDDLVSIVIEADTGETFDDRDIARHLTPSEARSLAAMLWHVAEQVER